MLVLFVRDEIAIKNIGKEEGPRYMPYLLTAFFFILFMNLLGLFPWMATATGNLGVTLRRWRSAPSSSPSSRASARRAWAAT